MRNLTSFLIVMLLTCLIILTMFAEPGVGTSELVPTPQTEDPLILIPPPHLRHFTSLDGAEVIYFGEDEWIEFSMLVYMTGFKMAEAAAAEAARPLLAELEEKRVIIDERRKGYIMTKIGLGLGGAGAIGLSIYSFVNQDITGGLISLGVALVETFFLLR